MVMNKKCLLLIDCQYDFLRGGKLACENADKQMNVLTDYILSKSSEYTNIIATADWHPITHCSFKQNGGPFPVHCLAHSRGAAIYEPLVEACYNAKADFAVFTKGDDPDHEQFSIVKNEKSWSQIKALIKANGIDEIVVAGIAGEYCVKDSIKDIHKDMPNMKISALLPCIGYLSADGEKEFVKWINEEHPSTNIINEI